jgi:hypothetical protein
MASHARLCTQHATENTCCTCSTAYAHEALAFRSCRWLVARTLMRICCACDDQEAIFHKARLLGGVQTPQYGRVLHRLSNQACDGQFLFLLAAATASGTHAPGGTHVTTASGGGLVYHLPS